MRTPSTFPVAAAALCTGLTVALTGTVAWAGPAVPARGAATEKGGYDVQILRTSYGIPHVQAGDWGSLGYGYGYTLAQDNVCVLARELLVANGTQSRHFGAATVNNDFVYRMVNAAPRVEAMWARLDSETRALIEGYAAGYNRYLRDTPPASLPAECRNRPWVSPMNGREALKVLRNLLIRAGTGNFVNALVGARPPLPSLASVGAPLPDAAAAEAIDPAGLPNFSAERFGSNAVGLGGDLTGGAGALLGNPHFPWNGIERFYTVHLTIPGRYDAMGASIFGFPLVNIGFNRDVAWSHTVSTARRFVLRELAIVPGQPTSYRVDGQGLPMQAETVTAEVLQPDGSLALATHTFWLTKYGPVLVPAAPAAWTATQAWAITDVNLDNVRAFVQYREMGTARNVDEFAASLRRHAGLPWVNTVAVDRGGNAFYGDIGAVPNVTNARLAACVKPGVSALLTSLRLYALDGSTAGCDPATDADAPEPGIFGAGNLPSLLRRDYVQNSNDSYWLANPAQRLEGYSPLIGVDENRPQAFRTRLGITQIRDRQAGVDGLPGTGFNRQWLQDVLYANRHYSAEIMLDGVLALCASQNPVVTVAGQPVDVAPACGLLARWDRRNRIASVGPHIWGELWRRIGAAPGAGLPVIANVLYAVPFDPADPVRTPRGLNTGHADVATRVMGELAYTVRYFADNGIPLDRPWGQVQFDTRNGERIPIHGGSGPSGVYNAMTAGPLVPLAGTTQILAGSSYVQSVTFTPSGPQAQAVLTYSQSSDPANPHHADMTRLFANYGWVALPFDKQEIRRDPNLTTLTLKETR